MEIVAIEAQTFDRMLQRLKDMARITDEIYKMHGERKIGVDGQPGCLPSAWRKSPYLANIP
ncbi:MAG: hypothetical protein ACLSIB_09485 [Parabacteroides merdae]